MNRLLTVLLLMGVGVLGTATPALAHNVLVGSTPQAGAMLATGPAQVSLTFDLPVQPGPDTIAVIGPGGTHWEAGFAVVQGNDVAAPVRPLGPVGAYAVEYRILSADGHPVSGVITFTLTQAGTGTPGTPELATPVTAAGPAPDSGGIPVWGWIVGAVALLATGVAIALRLGGNPRP
jgi:methionine-rich copper-binding protein CopC